MMWIIDMSTMIDDTLCGHWFNCLRLSSRRLSIFQAVIYTGFYTFKLFPSVNKMAKGHKITHPMICTMDIFKINDVQMISCPRDMFLGVVGYHIKNQRL